MEVPLLNRKKTVSSNTMLREVSISGVNTEVSWLHIHIDRFHHYQCIVSGNRFFFYRCANMPNRPCIYVCMPILKSCKMPFYCFRHLTSHTIKHMPMLPRAKHYWPPHASERELCSSPWKPIDIYDRFHCQHQFLIWAAGSSSEVPTLYLWHQHPSPRLALLLRSFLDILSKTAS